MAIYILLLSVSIKTSDTILLLSVLLFLLLITAATAVISYWAIFTLYLWEKYFVEFEV